MKTVIIQFPKHPYPDDHADGETDRQPEYIDKRIQFMPYKIPICYFQMIPKHGELPD
jgi:hypothetical protein